MMEETPSRANSIARRNPAIVLLGAFLIVAAVAGLVAFFAVRSSSSAGGGPSIMRAIIPPSPLDLWRERGKASEHYVFASGDCGGYLLHDMVWSVDGSRIYAATTGGVQIMGVQGRRIVSDRILPPQHEPLSIAADPKGRWLAVGVWHGEWHGKGDSQEPLNPCYVDVYLTANWEKVIRLDEPINNVVDLCFSPDGEYLVGTSGRKTLLVWRTSDWSLVKTFEGFRWLGEGGMYFSPSGGLVLCESDGRCAVTVKYRHGWEGGWDWSVPFETSFGCVGFLDGKEEEVTCWVGEWLDRDGFRYPGGIERRKFGGGFERLAWTPSGPGLVAVGFKDTVVACINEFPGFVSLWRTSDFELIAHFAGVPKPTRAIAFDPSDRLLATAWGTGNIVIWDIPRIVADDEAGRLPAVLKQEDDNHWGRTPIEGGK